ncbi:serine/threonine protein kinase [Mycetocola tolaasinivorans]|uniref:non-specific serine/threonine protein kinase n=1 Tax=Mycetocola tolaasinivorans TaxID=76635 RepID=A0A3L7ACC1_9MICO|nr:serine/threonine-protein kinase [Mycetocola tolaasinivorans]RLP77032.1 serine/threonine protein kinase [Mycetocola tolaasinivorans]
MRLTAYGGDRLRCRGKIAAAARAAHFRGARIRLRSLCSSPSKENLVSTRTPSSPPVIPGYSYVRPLGSGGFAEVFLYEQDMPHRVVAVKVLNGVGHTDSTRRQFEAEADVMARLSVHPSIVSIYQASISADGRAYIAMEYCPDSMRSRMRGSTPLTLEQILDAGVRLAGALETAHRSGVLHRDLKPSNVLVTTLGRPVLADFGIAEVRGAVDPGTQIALSYPWAAPEVVDTRVSGTVRSEIWSLAATIYTFAAGRSPFEAADRAGNTREKLAARLTAARGAPPQGARHLSLVPCRSAHLLRGRVPQRARCSRRLPPAERTRRGIPQGEHRRDGAVSGGLRVRPAQGDQASGRDRRRRLPGRAGAHQRIHRGAGTDRGARGGGGN